MRRRDIRKNGSFTENGSREPSTGKYVVYFNRKAFMYRVHSRLYQVTQKIKERSLGVEASPLEFLKRLSNEA